MRIARIAMADALFGASVSARTFEAVGKVVLNPIDRGEVIDANIAKAVGGIKFHRVKGNVAFSAVKSKGGDVVHFIKKILWRFLKMTTTAV